VLASYACNPEKSKGRLYKEEKDLYRTEFQRDKERIIHSTAFRRLEYKTQVFVSPESDHSRNRLTHSLEVASLASNIARRFNLCSDIAEAVALAHDIGHTPFGHTGEDALNEKMKEYGGFDHNTHALKILTSLEQKYAAFNGLNLSTETLESIVKHNGPLKENISNYILEYNKKHDLDLGSNSCAEAQIAALADDIAYNSHDIDDGIRTGLFTLNSICSIKLIKYIRDQIKEKFSDIEEVILIHETIRGIRNFLTHDLIDQTDKNLKNYNINTCEDIKDKEFNIVSFSSGVEEDIKEIKAFLMKNMYRYFQVKRVSFKAYKIVSELFDLFMQDPGYLPLNWQKLIKNNEANVIADYIAGMTDRYAIKEYNSFFKQ